MPPLENFSYSCYIPETIMMLCGLRDGTATVTAQHATLEDFKTSVTVNVERLKDKLYLFQFAPAGRTTLYYVDSRGAEHTVSTNYDGSLALYEPDGIASDVYAYYSNVNESYRGTILNVNLKSGEGNGLERELYPLNSIELRPSASASFTLYKPDGSPLANTQLTLRGGVYRNIMTGAERDDSYCPDAKFYLSATAAEPMDGTEDMTFTTDENGSVVIHMDISQFTSELDPGEVKATENFTFIFELDSVTSGGKTYQPEIIQLDTSMTYTSHIRTGTGLITLNEVSGPQPVISSQTVNYTERDISTRRHTGVVGPSSDYPVALLSTQLLLWGMDDVTTEDTDHRFDIRTQDGAVVLPGQEHTNAHDASYPFSSMPVLENVILIDSSTLSGIDASKRIPIELAIVKNDGSLRRTVALPFGLIDMTTVEKISDSESVIELMARLAAFGTADYSNSSDTSTKSDKGTKIMDVASDLLDVLGMLEGIGSKMGLMRTILMPTEDPARFTAYIWCGYDTSEMADLRYDDRGVYLEPAYIFQDLEQISFNGMTVGDYQAMTNGTYQERLQSNNKNLMRKLVGEGSVMQGWMTAEIVYNFDKGEWQTVTTGGGYTFGKQLELKKVKQKLFPVVYNFSVTVRLGVVVSLETALRYAEQLGHEWDDETAKIVNDYLTSVRINGYLEIYGGMGIDYGLVATVGGYGSVELNVENRKLERTYLKNPNDRSIKGYFVQLDGTVGLREKVGIGSMLLEMDLVSITIGDQWRFPGWNEVNEYWDSASSGYSSAYMGGHSTAPMSLSSETQTVLASSSGVRLQSRNYLQAAERSWLGGGGISTLALETGEQNRLHALETNSYPYSMPIISDDGGMLLYLSDADSTDVEDIEARYALLNGEAYQNGTAIPSPADFESYGDSSLDFDGARGGAAGAVWLSESVSLDLSPNTLLTQE